jgi:tetratricopeptide (TPR) repeat protein
MVIHLLQPFLWYDKKNKDMKKFFIGFFLFFWIARLQAQDDRQMKILQEAQRKLDSLMKNDPNIKKYAGQNNQTTTVNIPTNINTVNPYIKKPDTSFLSKIEFPDRNEKALASIPAKPMDSTKLPGFIGDMKKKIVEAVGDSISGQASYYATLDADGISNAAVLCWYAGNDVKALELALEAAEKNPDDMNVLNNLSGILNLCGFPYKAVPILDYIDERDPGNSTVDNNRGQAYVQMGDKEKAEMYLKKAVSESPYHPEANYTLACIEYKKGNKGEAQKYCENCLRGGFITESWTMLRAINPKAKLMELIKDRYKQPDYFNPDKYPLPEQCNQADKAEQLTMVYKQYHNMIFFVGEKYRKLYKEEADYVKKYLPDQMMNTIKEKRLPLRPFGAFAVTVLADIEETYGETRLRLQKYDSSYFDQMKTLKDQCNAELKKVDKDFEDRADKAGEGNPDMNLEADMCKAKNEVADKYLPQFAALNESRQREWISKTKDYFNDYAFWSYVASTDDHQYNELFYSLVNEYLTLLNKLATTELINCKATQYDTKDKSTEAEFEKGKCPFKANIAVKVEKEKEKGKENEKPEYDTPAEFEIDCEEFKGTLDLGLVKFIFKTTPAGRTTLAFSGGWSANNKKSKVGQYLPASIGGKMQFGLVFGGGQPVDVNIKWDYNMKLPVAGENKAGWSVSMISGVEFHGDGILVDQGVKFADKNLFGLNPPPKQINPNIKMYKN